MTISWLNRTLFPPWTLGECGMTFFSRFLILTTGYHLLNTSKRLEAMLMQDELCAEFLAFWCWVFMSTIGIQTHYAALAGLHSRRAQVSH